MQKGLRAITGKVDINRDLVFLLVIGGLYSLGIFLSNTFVNIYLWKQAGDYVTIAMYNLGVYIFQPLAFIVAGKIAKKVDRIIVLRVGVIFLSLFFLSVLLIADSAAKYNFLLGSLLGVGFGFYWLAYDVLTFEITEPETRDFFNGFLGILESFGGMVGPLAAGIIISKMTDNIGYTVIFALSFGMFILAVVLSFFLKRRLAEGKFYFGHILSERRRNKNWKNILYAQTFQGLREGIFLFVITIWVFVSTKSEFSLGVFNLTLSALSFIFYFIATKYITPSRRKKAILIGGIILFGAVFIILFSKYYVLLLLYAILVGMAYPIIHVPYASLAYDVIGKANHAKELRVEYIVVKELFVNIGRVASIVVFLLGIFMFPSSLIVPILVAVFGAGHIFIYLFTKGIFLKKEDEGNVLFRDQVTDEKNR